MRTGKRPTLRDPRLFWQTRSRFIGARIRGTSGTIERVSTKCTHEAAAVLRANELEREAADPRLSAAAAYTWEQSVESLLAEVKRRGCAPATLSKYEEKLGHYPRIWADGSVKFPLSWVTAEKVDEYTSKRLTEVKRITIGDELGALKRLLKHAKRNRKFATELDEVLPLSWDPQYTPRSVTVSISQAWTLIHYVARHFPHRAAFFAFAFGVAARASEGPRALRSDVNIPGGVVRVRGTKTAGADAEIPITSITRPFLEYALKHADGGGELLLRPWAESAPNQMLRRACAALGFPRLSTNDLRRSCITWHREAGIESSLLTSVSRHTTDRLIQTTYGRLDARAAGKILGARLSSLSNLHVSDVSEASSSLPLRDSDSDGSEGKMASKGSYDAARSALPELITRLAKLCEDTSLRAALLEALSNLRESLRNPGDAPRPLLVASANLLVLLGGIQ